MQNIMEWMTLYLEKPFNRLNVIGSGGAPLSFSGDIKYRLNGSGLPHDIRIVPVFIYHNGLQAIV